jgi:hypothetical protein
MIVNGSTLLCRVSLTLSFFFSNKEPDTIINKGTAALHNTASPIDNQYEMPGLTNV